MSKAKTSSAKRPSPPDRDGDGAPGGSLPGNQTADAAKGPDEPAAEWTRDDELIVLKLAEVGFEINASVEDAVTLDQVKGWSDDQAKAVEAFAHEYVSGSLKDDGDMIRADGTVIELPHELHKNIMADEPELNETFTPEEIAAGQTDLVQEEGETAIAAAMAAPVIDDADPLVTIDTATAPVALRLGNLRRLVENRLFYKSPEGFSPNYHAPHVEAAEVEVWIANGLARWDETAGRIGGVYVEPEASRVLRGHPRTEAA